MTIPIHGVVLLASFARLTAMPVEVRLVDGVGHELVAETIEIDGRLTIRTSDSETRTFPIQDVDQVMLVKSGAAPAAGEWLFVARDQSRLIADLVPENADAVVARHARLGDIRLEMNELVLVCKRECADDLAGLGGDTIRLVNGDSLSGAILGIDRLGAAMLVEEDVRTTAWSAIRELRFNRPPDQAPAPSGLKLFFADGSNLRAASLRIDERGQATAQRDGQRLTAEASFLHYVEVLGGRRVWLSDLPTARYESTPFFERTWPLRVDANAVGGPLRIAGREYAHGLGLHAACRVQWRLDGRYQRLLAAVGMDDSAGPFADADLKILRDDSVVFAAAALRSGEAPRGIDVDLRGADSLTVVVDFASHGPVQDRVNLVNPKLIRLPSDSVPAAPQPGGR